MAGELKKSPLGELIENLDSIRVPVKGSERHAGIYPYYGASGIVDYVDKYLFDGEYLLIAEDGENLKTRNTPIAFLARGKFWVNNHAHIVRANKKANTRFLMYALAGTDISGYLSGTIMPKLTQGNMNRILVPAPKPEEQSVIAHILGSLDDKIELNRKMNETLEAMARALFKSWFVDFDPVHAKAAGRDTGLPKDIADLFPSKFQDSELGEIPKGWEAGKLGDIAENPRRGVQPDLIEPETPYIALEHMPRRCIALSDWGKAKGLESNKFKFEKGEILFGKLRPYFHKVGIAPVDGVCSTDIVVVVPKQKTFFSFALLHLSSDEFVAYTNANSGGTKMPRTSWNDMADYPIAVPPKSVAETFEKMVSEMMNKIIFNIYESRCLAIIRDSLLPKIISGEIHLGGAA